jgi:hypothetical protein
MLLVMLLFDAFAYQAAEEAVYALCSYLRSLEPCCKGREWVSNAARYVLSGAQQPAVAFGLKRLRSAGHD